MSRKPAPSDDAIDFFLCLSLDVREERHGQKKGGECTDALWTPHVGGSKLSLENNKTTRTVSEPPNYGVRKEQRKEKKASYPKIKRTQPISGSLSQLLS